MSIKAILFDFGGTLDTSGVHWYPKFKELYQQHQLPVDDGDLREAYIYAERELGKMELFDNIDLFDLLYIKIKNQLLYLKNNCEIFVGNDLKLAMVTALYKDIEETLNENFEIIKSLKNKYKIAIVSNFYGNLKFILERLDYLKYLDLVVDSKKIGIRKPDVKIWQFAIDELNLKNQEVAIIGDSYENDILPAMKLGTRSIWLKNKLWKDTAEGVSVDVVVDNFRNISEAIKQFK